MELSTCKQHDKMVAAGKPAAIPASNLWATMEERISHAFERLWVQIAVQPDLVYTDTKQLPAGHSADATLKMACEEAGAPTDTAETEAWSCYGPQLPRPQFNRGRLPKCNPHPQKVTTVRMGKHLGKGPREKNSWTLLAAGLVGLVLWTLLKPGAGGVQLCGTCAIVTTGAVPTI
ncbi:Hypothetical predicted protein [Pelobates cultripes]|uniref:Uncharacterized protein n=1 Tax=Pelobates cultripes TaxID=61616 RepID=A0AAD1SWR7_PELCU|nr:Hypothetical predicted protein [Pelobates cultripes]